MTYEKTVNEENESRIELSILMKCVLKKWKTLVASGIIVALLGVIIAAVTYVPQYSVTLSYVINSKTNTESEWTTGNFMVAEYLANTYSYVITSRDFIQSIKAETGIDENINKYISSQLVDSSNIMRVIVRTEDPQKTYSIARAISIYLPEKAKATVSSGSLNALEEPVEPLLPDSNSGIKKMAVFGFALGLVAAAAVVVMIQLVKNAAMRPEDITNNMDIKHIGSVPHLDINKKSRRNKKGKKTGKGTKHEPMLLTNKKTGFVFGETYKSMRTKIERFAKKNNAKVILVTSALENEGKTTVAANVALSLAQNDNNVLLMDCDLRKPAVATILDSKDRVKISSIDVITGKYNISESIIKLDGNVPLDIVGSNRAVNNSSEVLSTQGLKKVLDSIRDKYDYIILDTPPSHLFTDATIISEYTDAAILVVRQNGANVDDVISVANDISQSKAKLIGFVFNNVSDMSVIPGGYSKKYNYSYYGYGRGE